MNHCTEEFVKHRAFEYGYEDATLCRICTSWEIGHTLMCGNQACKAGLANLKHLKATWSTIQAKTDAMNEFCIECKRPYFMCSCEWKRKHLIWKNQNEMPKKQKNTLV